MHDLLQNKIFLGFIGSGFGWFTTMSGALLIFFLKDHSKGEGVGIDLFNSISMGIASGIMLAASFWSLFIPALDIANERGLNIYINLLGGFTAGGILLFSLDKLIPHLHLNFDIKDAEGLSRERFNRLLLMIFAITLHNFPEGMSVGTVFGGIDGQHIHLHDGISIALGIAFQDIPEGFAVAIVVWQAGFSRKKAFWIGQLSGIVEPIGGFLGAWFSSSVNFLLPFVLTLAAGAMIFIIVEEMIPSAQKKTSSDYSTVALFIGFLIMTYLDWSLG